MSADEHERRPGRRTCGLQRRDQELRHVRRRRRPRPTVPSGSFFALLGPSGCGKTTTLRMVAGLEDAHRGTILLGGRGHHRRQAVPAAGQHGVPELRAVPAPDDLRERRVRAAPHAAARTSKSKVDEACSSWSSSAQYAERKPAQLSGGQQQRVALARALINRPQVLLLDEPLGALDLKLRRQMQLELKRIQTEVGLTFVHVTHDQEEAMTMADTVAVMNAGVIEQLGAPGRALRAPAHHVRRQLPRPVQPDRGHRHGPRRRRPASASTCTAPTLVDRRATARAPARAATVLGRRPPREDAARRRRASRPTAGATCCPAASSPTSASSASAPSTSSGCRGARS